jgi:hypothetical protein
LYRKSGVEEFVQFPNAGVDFRVPRTTIECKQVKPAPEEPMKYLCLVYHEEAKIDALPESEYNTLVNDVLDYREELRQSGHYIMSSPLHYVETATTIRVRSGKVSITDGPFAETKEQLGGFYLIEARDLNEALRLASRMPPARVGSIEVRPLKELHPDAPRG